MLVQSGHNIITFDNLVNGHRDAVKYGHFIEGDIGDTTMLAKVFEDEGFDVVMHFASFIEVGESVSSPSKYYLNNFSNTLNLLDIMVKHGVNKFIFSSKAAIFGEPQCAY